MDFSTFDTKPVAEKGAEMHVAHPVLGHLLYDGKGADDQGKLIDKSKPHEKVTITVRGWHSPSVQAAIKATQSGKVQQRSEAELEVAGEKIVDALIVDWSNVSKGGEALDCTATNKAWLVEQNYKIFEQVYNFAQDQANFFGGAAKT